MCLITAADHREFAKNPNLRGIPQVATSGDVVTLQWDAFEAENGFVAESLFDRDGIVRFVLDGGNYLPGIHELVHNLRVGDRVQTISIDAGYGARRKDLVFRLPESKVKKLLTKKEIADVKVGDTFCLKDFLHVTVTEIQNQHDAEPVIVLDANHPLAGSSYLCSFTVLNIEQQTVFDVATFAMGCFWGGELAFQRQRGVVGTRSGYTQGVTANPTYEEVSSGETQHREAVQVLYDPKEVSYQELLQLALSRLYDIPLLERMFQHDEDEPISPQYRHGVYYHCEQQRHEAERAIGNDSSIELLAAARFWPAEEAHQQYLYKRGQSARKGAKEPIRCFG